MGGSAGGSYLVLLARSLPRWALLDFARLKGEAA
jgi:hypothetical protein